ncbi:MAG: peptidyl-prolyl cis-trans isomerase [Acidobacteria bacterium]|nr:peptidyl-prolyl cis-trans isomerase [Acidobacteriota bacterium]MYJ05726.1 peptidyl-prolyl cis-trans isomerase [Acidobacteriota bacterium]
MRDPLLLTFLLLGAAVFAVDYWLGDRADERPVVEVTADQVEQLRVRWMAQWGRAPNPEELQGLVDEAVDEEILYREAQRLGLGRDDAIVRRRLAQKLTFLLEDAGDAVAPTEEEIAEYFARESERYRRPARTSFDHVFLSGDRRTDAARDARALLDPVRADGNDGWERLGDPFMLARSYVERSDQEIAGLFGTDFAQAVADLPTGDWKGPVVSTYGVHLVRVNGRTAARAPALAELRDRVVADLRQERRRERSLAGYEELRESYEVRLPAGSSERLK